MARLLGRQFADVQFLERLVDLLGKELALVKHDQFHAGRAGALNERPIVGILIAIPIHGRRRFERSGVAVKDGQPGFFQVQFNLGFQNIKIRFHRHGARYQTLHGITRNAGESGRDQRFAGCAATLCGDRSRWNMYEISIGMLSMDCTRNTI